MIITGRSGKTASENITGVNTDGRLFTDAVTQSGEHYASQEKGNSYFANTTDTADTLTTATGNTYNMLYLQNTSQTFSLVIEKVISSADTAGGVVKWIKNPTLGSIGANNTHTPVNLNFGSGNTADAVAYNWDETGAAGMTGLSGGTTLKTFITGVGFTIHPIDGSLVLSQNDCMLIQYINGTGGAVEFECGIRFYFNNV